MGMVSDMINGKGNKSGRNQRIEFCHTVLQHSVRGKYSDHGRAKQDKNRHFRVSEYYPMFSMFSFGFGRILSLIFDKSPGGSLVHVLISIGASCY